MEDEEKQEDQEEQEEQEEEADKEEDSNVSPLFSKTRVRFLFCLYLSSENQKMNHNLL